MKKYRLVRAFHPSAYEDDVYSVFFVEIGKPLLDRYTKHFLVKANSKADAIKKARNELNIVEEV